jgi:predicted helicase
MSGQDAIVKMLYKRESLNDMYPDIKKKTNKEKGDIFEVITYWLFKLMPALNNDLKDIWLYDNVPTNIKKELTLPSRDKGIDLLLQLKNGDYYAIQCKFRQNPNTIITWTEVATFFGLAFGLHNKIKGGYFVTNTYDLCEEVINSTLVNAIYGTFFDEIPKEVFLNIGNSIKNIKPREYIIKKPLDHQQICINKCTEHYKDNDKGYIEMACGTGKTVTSYWVIN